MEKQIAPIPALYACYLLRSIARHSSLYVGSTPHPPRRLSQHNGETKGGAARTSRDSLRPWEMTCLVTGFPSKIAALQFEWAWQNPNMTRHIAPQLRITQSKMTSRISPRTGRVHKRSSRPRLSLTDRLANLHLLLRSKSFSRWPLKLTFFSSDVYRVWTKLPYLSSEPLRAGIEVTEVNAEETSRGLTPAQTTDDGADGSKATGIYALDVGYSRYIDRLRRSASIFDHNAGSQCVVCCRETSSSGVATLVCPEQTCSAVSHLQCLSARFLHHEKNAGVLLPTAGSCPSCGTKSQWIDLVRELTLRMRGENMMKALLKPKRVGKKAAVAAVAAAAAAAAEEEEDPNALAENAFMEPFSDNSGPWHELSESGDEDLK